MRMMLKASRKTTTATKKSTASAMNVKCTHDTLEYVCFKCQALVKYYPRPEGCDPMRMMSKANTKSTTAMKKSTATSTNTTSL